MRRASQTRRREIYASLLDEGVYHCSIRTMYRILGQHGEVRERREQLRHPAYRKPELIAELPIRSGPGLLIVDQQHDAHDARMLLVLPTDHRGGTVPIEL